MKVFYNDKGEIKAIIEGATPEIEANMSMPNYSDVVVSEELAKRVNDPKDVAGILTLKVQDSDVVGKTTKEIKAIEKSLHSRVVKPVVDSDAEVNPQ